MDKKMETLLKRITVDPEVCHGAPCIRGTRIHIDVILEALASGESEDEILADYPRLTHEDVAAALAYAAKTFQPS